MTSWWRATWVFGSEKLHLFNLKDSSMMMVLTFQHFERESIATLPFTDYGGTREILSFNKWEWKKNEERREKSINENNTQSYTQHDNKEELWQENIAWRVRDKEQWKKGTGTSVLSSLRMTVREFVCICPPLWEMCKPAPWLLWHPHSHMAWHKSPRSEWQNIESFTGWCECDRGKECEGKNEIIPTLTSSLSFGKHNRRK